MLQALDTRFNAFLQQKKTLHVVFAVALILWVVLQLLTLDGYPPAHCDEAFWSEVAYRAWTEGRFAIDAHLGIAASDVSIAEIGRIFEGSIALTQGILGLSLWSARLSSLIAGVLGAFLLYRVTRALFGDRPAVVALVLYATSWRVVYFTHFTRPELWVIAASLLMLWMLWRVLENPSPSNSLLAGLCASLIVDVHLNGFHFALAASLIVLAANIHRRSWKSLGLYICGGLIGLVYWLAAHLLPDPEVFRYQVFEFYANWGLTDAWNRTVFSELSAMAQFFWQQFIAYNGYLSAVTVLYFITGLVAVFWSDRVKQVRVTLIYFALALVSFTALSPKLWFYAVIWFGLIFLVTAAGLEVAAKAVQRRLLPALSWQLILTVLVLPLVGIYVAGGIYRAYNARNIDFDSYARQVTSVIPPGETLVAPHQFWYTRPDDPFVATTTTTWMTALKGLSFNDFDTDMGQEFLDMVSPAYVVLMPGFLCIDETAYNRYEIMQPIITNECDYVSSAQATGYPQADLYYCGSAAP